MAQSFPKLPVGFLPLDYAEPTLLALSEPQNAEIFVRIALILRITDGLRVAPNPTDSVSRRIQRLTFYSRLRLSRVFGSDKGGTHEEPLRGAVWRRIGDTCAGDTAYRESILGNFTLCLG